MMAARLTWFLRFLLAPDNSRIGVCFSLAGYRIFRQHNGQIWPDVNVCSIKKLQIKYLQIKNQLEVLSVGPSVKMWYTTWMELYSFQT